MNHLFGSKMYMSGPIEFCGDINWRNEPKKILSERFGINILPVLFGLQPTAKINACVHEPRATE